MVENIGPQGTGGRKLKNTLLENNGGSLAFKEDRFHLFSDGKPLSAPEGIIAPFHVNGKLYGPFDAVKWEIIEDTEDRIKVKGFFDGFSQIIDAVKRGKEFNMKVFLDNHAPVNIRSARLSLHTDSPYAKWTNSSRDSFDFGLAPDSEIEMKWIGRPDNSFVGLENSSESPSVYMKTNSGIFYSFAKLFGGSRGGEHRIMEITALEAEYFGVRYEPGNRVILDCSFFLCSPPPEDKAKRNLSRKSEAEIRKHFKKINVGPALLEDWVKYANQLDRGYSTLLFIEGMIGPVDGKKVLDAGCGWGVLANAMAEKGGDVYGIEHVPAHIRVTNMRNETIKGVVSNGKAYSFKNMSFDVVIANDVLEHIGNTFARRDFIGEAARVLKPGGLFYFQTGNFLNPYNGERHLWFLHWIPRPFCHWYVRLFKKGKYYDDAWLPLWYTPWGIKSQLQGAGFEIVKVFHAYEHMKGYRIIVRGPFMKKVLDTFYENFIGMLFGWEVVCRKKEDMTKPDKPIKLLHVTNIDEADVH